jgi:VWFA-related protein
MALRMLALVLALLQAQAQPPSTSQAPFKSGVELVQIDLVVLDADGRPIRGLTAADFTVLDRGRVQTLEGVDEIAYERPAGGPPLPHSVPLDVADNARASSDRVIVVVIDDLHVYTERTEAAREIARKIVERLAPGSSMAMFTTSGRQKIELTMDRARLLKAIAETKGLQMRRKPNSGCDPSGIHNTSGIECDLLDYGHNQLTLGGIRGAARALGRNDGRRKAFVMISEGVGKQLGSLFTTGRGGDETIADSGTYATSGEMPTDGDVTSVTYFELLDMMGALHRSNVALYAIDPRGFLSERDRFREHEGDRPVLRMNDPIVWAQEGLRAIADFTGGFAVTDSSDFDDGLARIARDLDNYYLLSFRPDDPTRKGYRRLDVQVNRPGAQLRYRRGFELGRSPAPPKNTDPLAALQAAVVPTGDLPIRLFAAPLPTGRKDAAVAVTLEIAAPRAKLLEPDGRLVDSLTYSVLAADLKSTKIAKRFSREAQLALKPVRTDGDSPEQVRFQISTTLELEPGPYQLRVAAISRKLEAGGSVHLTLDVPDFQKTPLAVGGLVLGYADGPRVASAASQASPGARAALPFGPSVDREFRAGDRVRLYVPIWRRETGAATVKIQAVDRSGQAVGEMERTVAADAAGTDVVLPLRGFDPGPYTLRVVADDGRAQAVREIGFTVR